MSLLLLDRRAWLRNAGLALAAAGLGCSEPEPSRVDDSLPVRNAVRAVGPLRLLGEATLPWGFAFGGTRVGGLSAIEYDLASDEWLLLSDGRAAGEPARVYRARMPIHASGVGPLTLESLVALQRDDLPMPGEAGTGARRELLDPEALRRLPNGNWLWTTEGDFRRDFGPAVRECRADGTAIRRFEMPPVLQLAPDALRAERGPRRNAGLEGLALSPDGATVWAAMESALVQDGPPARLRAAGGPCRITAFDVAAGRATRQIAYVPDPVPSAGFFGLYGVNGISEILMQDERHMLVLERAYVFGAGNSVRLYSIDTAAGTDILDLHALTPDNHRAAPKTLLADLSTVGLAHVDNLEGMAWGPMLPAKPDVPARRTLVMVSDDNFNPSQTTQVVAFAFTD